MGKVYREKPFEGTSFDRFIPQYHLNHKGQLERSPIDKDMDEYIQSQKSTLFERMLDQVSSGGIVFDENDSLIEESVRHSTNLDIMLETDRIIEEYRKENNLPEDMSRAEIYDFINNRVGQIKKEFENKKKEGKDNEKEISSSQESE